MPCYEVRTVSVEFKVGNIDLLKKALEKSGWTSRQNIGDDSKIYAHRSGQNYGEITIDLKNSIIKSQRWNEKEMTDISNSIKRAYSGCVIDEVAKKQKWMKKKMGENRYQLQRF